MRKFLLVAILSIICANIVCADRDVADASNFKQQTNTMTQSTIIEDDTDNTFIDDATGHVKDFVHELIHKHEYTETSTNADCYVDGVTIYTCECGETYSEITEKSIGHSYVEQIVPPTCEEEGYTLHICEKCNHSYKDTIVEATGHSFPDGWILEVAPTKDSNGIEYRYCHCGYMESRPYICEHHNVHKVVVSNATCTKHGVIDTVCELCNKVIKSEKTPIASHIFGEWKTIKRANPIENGIQERTCSCGKKEERTISFKSAGSNSIYIESAGINAAYVIESFTQKAVDTYDVICNYSRLDYLAPIILGHNTGSLKKLYNTKVGSNIYMYVDGELHIYEVVTSEKAVEVNDEGFVDIGGLETNRRLLFDKTENTLRLYTCYKDAKLGNIRWLVFAEKVN